MLFYFWLPTNGYIDNPLTLYSVIIQSRWYHNEFIYQSTCLLKGVLGDAWDLLTIGLSSGLWTEHNFWSATLLFSLRIIISFLNYYLLSFYWVPGTVINLLYINIPNILRYFDVNALNVLNYLDRRTPDVIFYLKCRDIHEVLYTVN